ncbi:hypothetical protein [Leucobacter sp. cx-169]|uniref:hypothetical protein n=1 Tax=Leucobacter sp. cx-169 TaxID=2770549 RepID=UPI00165E0433|nr:hypothetical protein [Leucobacter sp. cx-169]MBC9927338.1 hypothetical protein [Leucobacter sp. cx-169]
MSRPYAGAFAPSSKECSALLTDIRHARSAAEVTATVHSPAPGFLYALPLFLRDTNVAITWDVPLVGALVDGEELEATWRHADRYVGPQSGQVRLHTRAEPTDSIDLRIARFRTPRVLAREIERIKQVGVRSQWELSELFRPYVVHLLGIASKKVAAEISEGTLGGSGVIDSVEQESLADDFLLGDIDRKRKVLFPIIVERAVGDLPSTVGDRVTYIVRNAESALESSVRRAIGDPTFGRSIRLIHRELGANTSSEAIKKVWKDRYPERSGLSDERILRSLTVDASVNAASFSVAEEMQDLLFEEDAAA